MRRKAFTLVELLVATAIIALLAGIFLAALYAAQDQARRSKATAQVAKLQEVVFELYESYATRRPSVKIPDNATPVVAAGMRLNGIREMMRMEMPDRWTDVADAPVVLSVRPSLSERYLRAYNAHKTHPNIDQWQSAECLYLIIAAYAATRDDVGDYLRSSEVGDKDGDGLNEFHDAWSEPISFLRWAPGFRSIKQEATGPATPMSNPASMTEALPLAPIDPNKRHDPFDTRKIDPDAFELWPVVYSFGPDRISEVNRGDSALKYSTRTKTLPSGFVLKNYPYLLGDPSQPRSRANDYIGTWVDTDDIPPSSTTAEQAAYNSSLTFNNMDNINGHELVNR